MVNPGQFLFVFCLTLLLYDIRKRPDCPWWLNPLSEEQRENVQRLPKWAVDLLPLGIVIGLILHFMTYLT